MKIPDSYTLEKFMIGEMEFEFEWVSLPRDALKVELTVSKGRERKHYPLWREKAGDLATEEILSMAERYSPPMGDRWSQGWRVRNGKFW